MAASAAPFGPVDRAAAHFASHPKRQLRLPAPDFSGVAYEIEPLDLFDPRPAIAPPAEQADELAELIRAAEAFDEGEGVGVLAGGADAGAGGGEEQAAGIRSAQRSSPSARSFARF